MSSKFKVGDKVKVKPFFLIEAEAKYIEEEEAGNLYYFDRNRTPFNENMKQFCENEFIIMSIESRTKGDIYFGLDGVGRWVITEDMVMPVELNKEEFEEIVSKIDEKIAVLKEELSAKIDELNSVKEAIEEIVNDSRKKVEFIDTINLGDRVRVKWDGASIAGEYIFCVGSRADDVMFVNANTGYILTPCYTREDLKARLIELLENKDIEFIELIEE